MSKKENIKEQTDVCEKVNEESIVKGNNSATVKDKTWGDIFPNTEVIAFNGPIVESVIDKWIATIKNNRSADLEDASVIFCTCGGNPDIAFRMSRFLQNSFKKIHAYVLGECYSAGTLFCLGANKIFMTDNAQLGPLDIQIWREDEMSRMSGECYRQALTYLGLHAANTFRDLFSQLRMSNRALPISTATASRVASEIVVGLLSPITAQIEPIKLGEVLRMQSIGYAYGKRLMKDKYDPRNIETILTMLTSSYPSHSTVIDYREAKSLGLWTELWDLKSLNDDARIYLEQLYNTQQSEANIDILTYKNLQKC